MPNYTGTLHITGSAHKTGGITAEFSGDFAVTLSATLNGSGTGSASETVNGSLNARLSFLGGSSTTETERLNFSVPNISFQIGSFDSHQTVPATVLGISTNLNVGVNGSLSSNAQSISENLSMNFSDSVLGITASGTMSAQGTLLSVASVTPGTVGVYRFFDKHNGTHFFTASLTERDGVATTRPDLTYEGAGLVSVDPAVHDPNATAVFRFFDTTHGTHFFTADAAEKDLVIATRKDLTFEGSGFFEHATQQAGDTAVYRFFDTQFGTHFYTSSASERASIVVNRPDLKEEGIGFYAPSS